MDILEALAQEQEKEERQTINNDEADFATMHPDVFALALKKAGCADDIIEDCLFEPRTLWDKLLEYYENKKAN